MPTGNIILLDTHVWLWLMNGDPSIKADALKEIQKAANDDAIKISAISVWEIAMLEARERIILSCDCRAWVKQALAAPGISLSPLTPEIAIESARLPGSFHGDPADRILAATARELNATLFTRDKKIIAYGKTKHVKVRTV